MFKDIFVLDRIYLGMLNKLNLTISKAERLIEDISFEYVMEPDDKDIYLGGMADHLEIHIPDKKLDVIKKQTVRFYRRRLKKPDIFCKNQLPVVECGRCHTFNNRCGYQNAGSSVVQIPRTTPQFDDRMQR